MSTYQLDSMAESGQQVQPSAGTYYKPRIEYLYKMPAEVVKPIKALVDKWCWLTPPWCQDLLIGWDGEGRDDGRIMECEISYRYRRVKIKFYGGFLDSPPDKREESFIHELCHSFVGVAVEFAEDTISRLIPEDDAPKFRETVLAELAERHESAVQDLAFRIYQKCRK